MLPSLQSDAPLCSWKKKHKRFCLQDGYYHIMIGTNRNITITLALDLQKALSDK